MSMICLTNSQILGSIANRCPTGYWEFEGTFEGATLGDMERNLTIDQCAEICNEEILCNAFEYEIRSKSCKPNHDPNPTTTTRYREFFFCQKQSKKLTCIESFRLQEILVCSILL